jgi:hypothetical protein
MKREVFQLVVFSTCAAYLFYYVLSTRGGYFAGVSVGLLVLHFVVEWSQMLYRLGRGEGR